MATHDGRIELIIGPMFSEKTTEMMSRVRRAAYAGEPGLMLDEERLTRGGRALLEVLKAYGGDWLRHLPLLMLAASLGGDALHVAKAYRALKDKREREEVKPVTRPADPPDPSAMKGGAS